MKRIALFVAAMLVATSAQAFVGVKAKDVTTDPNLYYSTTLDALDSAAILPAPPAYGSIEFLLDQARYQEGLVLREGPRGEMAAFDADGKNMPQIMSEAFGVAITREDTPEIYELVTHLSKELGTLATKTAKDRYMRVRPFVLYNTGTCYPKDEDRLRHNGSFPSGHSSRGWGVALVLAEINPANKEAILNRGYEVGQSRVICGYHWQSDVDAGRTIAAAAVAGLHGNALFLEQVAKAKAEFARLKADGKIK